MKKYVNFLKCSKRIVSIAVMCGILSACITANVSAETIEQTPEIQKIPITASQIWDECIVIIDESFVTPATALIDEQDKMPQTPAGKLLDTPKSKNWEPIKKSEYAPVSCLIDLGAYYYITNIGVYDTNGSSNITFRYGELFQMKDMLNASMSQYLSWRMFTVQPQSTRYIQIESSSTQSSMNELALYGYRDESKQVEDIPYQADKKTITTADKAVGANGFVDDPMDVLGTLGNVREYHNLDFSTKNGLNYFSPSANGYWDFDQYYQNLSDRGIEAIPCIQGTSDWILGNGETYPSKNNIPVPAGADTLNPMSYKDHASVMFQYAARYGNTKVEESKLLLGDNQTPKTGLGYLNYYENFNEQNKDWEGKQSYMSPYEYAAMCSADYDGHEGKLGDTYGIANADPDAKLAMAGLVGRNVIPYLEGMKFWFEHNRSDRKFVPDVINFHQYVTENCPEQSGFKEKLQDIAQWRDENLPDKELWLSEFNVIANDKVIPNVANKDNPDYLEARGARLTRAYLLALSAGMDKLSMFMSRDTSWGVYADDGLVTEKGAWKKKPAWYYVSTIKDALTDTVFDSVIAENEQVYIYKFTDVNQNGKEVYVLWSPTINGSQITNYSLNIGDKTKATLTEMQNGFSDGVKSHLQITDGCVNVSISERPIFVTVSENNVLRPAPTMQKITITPEMVSAEPKYQQSFLNLFDQQNDVPQSPTMALDKSVTFQTPFGSFYNGATFPLTSTIDLGEEYVITHIAFYDTNGTGKIELLEGTPENWKEETKLSYGLNSYLCWKVQETAMTTRYLQIKKYDNAQLTQIGIYGYKVSELDRIEKQAPEKIPVTLSQITPNKEKYTGDVQCWFDEQATAPNSPAEPFTAIPVTRHSSYWGKSADFPMTGIIDLQGEYVITHIAVYDTYDVGEIKFTIGDGQNWNDANSISYGLNTYQKWVVLDTNMQGRYLKIDKFNNAVLNEIVLYGYRIS